MVKPFYRIILAFALPFYLLNLIYQKRNNMKKLFNITWFEKIGDTIHLEVNDDTYEISLEKFELFLLTHDRLNWQINYSDQNGNHVQRSGVMSMDEYWDSNKQYILEDFNDFLVINILDIKKVSEGIFACIDKIKKW